ncbi:MAG: adenylate/guanylate cyclase domain-containing protein [Spirochaetes bacterium]|nr:MAG: adenylate/guanylate cyclase domain-containing protein [Spirochaetota bacterium]
MKTKSGLIIIIPVIVALFFSVLSLFSFFNAGEKLLFDILLHIKPAVSEDKSIVLIDIDDPSIAQVGVWPWSRDIVADGLILMKELGAEYALFDIEYTEASPLGVNARMLKEEIPNSFANEFLNIEQNTSDLFTAIEAGFISIEDASDYISDLQLLNEDSKDILLSKVADIAQDNDKYLGNAARFFGNTFFTINMLPYKEGTITEEHKKYAFENIALDNIEDIDGSVYSANDIRPVIIPILKNAAGAGFPNVNVDGDGVMRRVDLIEKFEDLYFPQLVFAPLLSLLGDPDVEVYKNKIILKDAVLSGKDAADINIPLTVDGRMLINWPKKNYIESFRHLSYYELVLNKELENRLLENLRNINDAGYLSYFQSDSDLLETYQYAEDIKNDVLAEGDLLAIEDYKEIRDYFFTEVGNFLKSNSMNALLADIEAVIQSPEVSEDIKNDYIQIKSEVPGVFAALKDVYSGLMDSRERIFSELNGSFCIIGQTGTSTTDIGVNPFEEEYMNVGIHASVLNTIYSGEFLDDRPWWYSSILALLLSFLVMVILRKLKPIFAVGGGFIFTLLVLFTGGGFFLGTGIYLNLLAPVLSVFFTSILIFVVNFFLLEKEKSFIRNAFSHYLSPDVISQLVSNPDKLNLGGEKKRLTAIFTDVQGFSTISETLDPSDLVKLLNSYLTEMSNTILDLRGTIDKYEGDAIIAFFGAPVEYEEHAENACLSAVRMRGVEKKLNEYFLKEQMSPVPLFTRIGINTGDMVVGNMGTPKKMDYTIMGNAVNLAARLEGVNKQYGTGILVSEETYKTGASNITARQLDRVRVVGINTPVRLYELVEEKSLTDDKTLEALDIFQTGLLAFEEREWVKAQKYFMKVLKIIPADGPSKKYIQRCKDNMNKPPAEDWDGVFSLTMK